MSQLYTLMGIRHSLRTPYSWTKGLVEVQNKNRDTHLRIFLQNAPNYWAPQVHIHAYPHNSKPLSSLNVSAHAIVFHTRPRIPFTFDLNLNRDSNRTCISKIALNCLNIHTVTKQILTHSISVHYLNLFLNGFLQKKLLCYKFILQFTTTLSVKSIPQPILQ